MEIEGTTFGTITIDGKTYEHDVDKFSSARTRINRVALSRKIEHQHAD
jgi:hypothetical protein